MLSTLRAGPVPRADVVAALASFDPPDDLAALTVLLGRLVAGLRPACRPAALASHTGAKTGPIVQFLHTRTLGGRVRP